MKTIKPAHLKRVIDFIHNNDNQYCGKELRYFFNNDLHKFIQLLHEAVKSAEVVPSVVIPFYRKVSQMHEVKQTVNNEEINMKNSNPSNQKKETSFVFIVVKAVKSAFDNFKSFLKRNMRKAQFVGVVVIAATIAKAVGLNTGLIMTIAAVKGKGLMTFINGLVVNVIELVSKAKTFVVNNADGAFAVIKASGNQLLIKIIQLKDLVIAKVKQLITWIMEAFTLDEHEYAQAA